MPVSVNGQSYGKLEAGVIALHGMQKIFVHQCISACEYVFMYM